MTEDAYDKPTLHQKYSNHPMLIGEAPILNQQNKSQQGHSKQQISNENLFSNQQLVLRQQQSQQESHLHSLNNRKSSHQTDIPNSPFRSPAIGQDDMLYTGGSDHQNAQITPKNFKQNHFNYNQNDQAQRSSALPIDISMIQNNISTTKIITHYDKNSVIDDLSIIDHSLTIKHLQYLYKFDGERGLSQHQVVKNRNLYKTKQQDQSKINFSKLEYQKWEIIKKLLIEYKFMILLAAIIFFFYFGYYQEDPSQILLALFLIWIVVLNKRKSFDELQQEKLANALKQFVPSTCIVIREGKEINVLTSSVVAGDIIILKKNSVVPVDSRVYSIATIDNITVMKADVSMLFQEKLPRILGKVCTYPTNYLKSQNVVPQGANIIEGSGRVIALMTANESFCQQKINQLADLSNKNQKTKNPIKSELNQFATILSYIAFIVAIIFLLVSRLAFDCSIITSFVFAGCVLIAFVPEGLLTQIYFAKFMRQNNIFTFYKGYKSQQQQQQKSFKINQYEQVIENLSQIDSICTNLSSLIEASQTEVSGIWVNNNLLGSVKDISIQQDKNIRNQTYQNLILGSILANESFFSAPNPTISQKQLMEQQGLSDYLPYEAEGSFIDAALLRFCQPICDVDLTRKQYPIVLNENGNHVMIHHDSQTQYCAALVHEKSVNGDYSLYIKGEPQAIWKLCTSIEIDNQPHDINENIHDQYKKAISFFQTKGEDTVAVAKLVINKNDFSGDTLNQFFDQNNKLNINLTKLTMIGLFSFSSPISNELQNSLSLAKLSGTKIFVITQKDPQTTYAIANNCGLFSQIDQHLNKVVIDEISNKNSNKIDLSSQIKRSSAVVVNGDRLKKQEDPNGGLDQLILECLSKEVCIFANTSSQEKYKLIPYLRQLGHKIAVTTDDIEDLSFISAADISFSGTQATPLVQKLSDVQLIRNRFQSDIQAILEAIEEGRCYQENVKKIFAFSGSTKMAQILPLFAFIIIRIPLAISAMFMILISCVTNFIPALSLAREEPDIDTLFISYYHQNTNTNESKRTPSLLKTNNFNRVATFKLFFYSYFFLGFIASCAGFCAFFTTMNHLGFPIKTTFELFDMKGYAANVHIADEMGYDIDVVNNYLQTIEDHYDIQADQIIEPHMPHWNSLFMTPYDDCEYDIEHYKPDNHYIDWADIDQSNIDLRKFYVYCDHNDKKWKTSVAWSSCNPTRYINYSTITENSACYTSEALNYAQTAYLLGIVFFQFSNLLALKSLRWSFIHTPFNPMLAFSLIFQLIICVFLVEIPGIQLIFRTRPLHFWQWGIPATPFSIFVLLHEEIRKFLARSTSWFKKIATF